MIKALVELHTADCEILGFEDVSLQFSRGNGYAIGPVVILCRAAGRIDHCAVHLVELDASIKIDVGLQGADVTVGHTVTCLFPDRSVVNIEDESMCDTAHDHEDEPS